MRSTHPRAPGLRRALPLLLALLLAGALAAAGPAAARPKKPTLMGKRTAAGKAGAAAELPPHPLLATELESVGLPGRDARPDLLDYWLGPVALTQDYLARDMVLLTLGRVVHVRVRAAAVEQLNLATTALLTRAGDEAGAPRRSTPIRLAVPPELERQARLVRLLGQGVSEQIEEIRLAPPSRDAQFTRVEMTYLAGGEQHRKEGSGPDAETAILDAFLALFPLPGAL